MPSEDQYDSGGFVPPGLTFVFNRTGRAERVTAVTRYRKKPIVVDALQWDPELPTPVLDWLNAHGVRHAVLDGGRLGVGTMESGDGLDRHAAKPGDYLIRGIRGEFYVCDRGVFADTYDPE